MGVSLILLLRTGSLAPGAEGVVDRCCRAGNSDDSTRAHRQVQNAAVGPPHNTVQTNGGERGVGVVKGLLTPKSLEVTA